jgi:hypothetical protein
MGDVSAFMRELKQRFGIWYNHQTKNHGNPVGGAIQEPDRGAEPGGDGEGGGVY